MRICLVGALVFGIGCQPGEWLPKSSYVLESIDGRSWGRGRPAWMNFHAHDFSASAGCGTFSAPYRLSDGALIIDGWGLQQLPGCRPADIDNHAWFKDFLGDSPDYVFEWPRLTFTDGDVTIVLLDQEVADPDRPLVGPAWEVEGMIAFGGIGFSTDEEYAALRFGDDGILAIETPCASGTASFTDLGDSVVLEAVDIGETDCPGDDVSYRYEIHMRELLIDGTFTYTIDAGVMMFERGDLGLYLTAP
jgi:heat shock protein HslJ